MSSQFNPPKTTILYSFKYSWNFISSGTPPPRDRLNYERFTFAKCLTFVRRNYPAPPELVCLKHYRAESDGWRNDIHCLACVTRTQNITFRDQMSASKRLHLLYLQATASLPTRFRIPYTLSHGTRTAQVRIRERDHIRSEYGAPLAASTPSATAPSRLSQHSPTFPMRRLLQETTQSLSRSRHLVGCKNEANIPITV